MNILKNISFYLLIGFGICLIATILKSDFIFHYLKENIIGLLITLLAINTATTGLVASKMQEMLLHYPRINFRNTIKEMKLSLFEQIILIILSVFLLIIADSKIIQFQNKDLITNSFLLATLIYALDILWDTGKSVFVAIENIQEIKDQNKNTEK